MRVFKLIGAMVIVLSVTVVVTTTALAQEILWPWLLGKAGTKFTGESGKVTFEETGGGTIKCERSEVSGEITSEKTLALATIDFTGCKALGFAVHSLGDKTEAILWHAHIHNCVISTGHAGLLIKPLPVHLEIPSLITLLETTGSFIVEIKPNREGGAKEFKLSEGTIKKCEGGSAETLLSSKNGEKALPLGVEAKEGKIRFNEKEEAMA
jgi:hypothetical protein